MPEEEKRIPCLRYSRVVGYIMPLENWHQGKQQEWKDRVMYSLGGLRLDEEDEEEFIDV